MKSHQNEEFIQFLKANVEPLDDNLYGLGYRVSAYLKDGTFLPCVIFRNPKTYVNLALQRFKETQPKKSLFGSSSVNHYSVIKGFVTTGNRISEYEIDRLELSQYAIPASFQKQIEGETTMGWTGFTAKMNDGKSFSFGTTFNVDFFDMPEGYAANDIIEIHNHSYISKSGEIKSHKYHLSHLKMITINLWSTGKNLILIVSLIICRFRQT